MIGSSQSGAEGSNHHSPITTHALSSERQGDGLAGRGGVLDGDTLYTSGKSGNGATIEAQMRDSLESIRGILKLAGMDLRHVVDAHVYLKDIGQMDAMNAVFKEYFPNNPPARTTVQVIQDQLEQVQVVAVR